MPENERTQFTARADKSLKDKADIICIIEGISFNQFVIEGLTLAVGLKTNSPEFQQKLQDFKQSIEDMTVTDL
jgi:hypothetical protein